MEKPKKDKEFVAALREVMFEEPLILMQLAQEEVLSAEAEVLDADLTRMGVSSRVRQQIYDHLSERRELHKAELTGPGAYERLRAKARVRGLLPPLPGAEVHHG